MLVEYAVDPIVVGSSWERARYLLEKFGFDRGRLISRYPKGWAREVHASADAALERGAISEIQRARIDVMLEIAKERKLIKSGRRYDPALGDWLANAVHQHQSTRFHAIISDRSPCAEALLADELTEDDPLMAVPHAWDVPRVGSEIAAALSPMLRCAKRIQIVDPFFDFEEPKYLETLEACFEVLDPAACADLTFEVHFRDRDRRMPMNEFARLAPKVIAPLLPKGLKVDFFCWAEYRGGEDFHARYLLTDVGGLNVESGFSAEGEHQAVPVSLLPLELVWERSEKIARSSKVYELKGHVVRISADGRATRL